MGEGLDRDGVRALPRRSPLAWRPRYRGHRVRGLTERGEPVRGPRGEILGDDEDVDVTPLIEVSARDRPEDDHGTNPKRGTETSGKCPRTLEQSFALGPSDSDDVVRVHASVLSSVRPLRVIGVTASGNHEGGMGRLDEGDDGAGVGKGLRGVGRAVVFGGRAAGQRIGIARGKVVASQAGERVAHPLGKVAPGCRRGAAPQLRQVMPASPAPGADRMQERLDRLLSGLLGMQAGVMVFAGVGQEGRRPQRRVRSLAPADVLRFVEHVHPGSHVRQSVARWRTIGPAALQTGARDFPGGASAS